MDHNSSRPNGPIERDDQIPSWTAFPAKTKALVGLVIMMAYNVLSNMNLNNNMTSYVLKNELYYMWTNNSGINTADGSDAKYNSSLIREQPYTGATDPEGNLGFVADATAVRKYMLDRLSKSQNQSARTFLPMTAEEFDYACNIPLGKGDEEPSGAEILNVVRVSPDLRESVNQSSVPKVLCVVYTHAGNHFRVTGIVETWGWRCDGFFAASTETVTSPEQLGFGAINLTHLGPEKYDNMWQKTRSILAYMYTNYIDDYDYFYLCGDDTHLIVENFLTYLSSLQSRAHEPLFIGPWYPALGGVFVGGGSGYAMNRVALERFIKEAMDSCCSTWEVSYEDRLLSNCFRSINITPVDTADEEGRQRFHGLCPSWLGSHRALWGNGKGALELWAQTHGYKQGANLTSPNSVSFHLLKTPSTMKREHAVLYGSCEALNTTFAS